MVKRNAPKNRYFWRFSADRLSVGSQNILVAFATRIVLLDKFILLLARRGCLGHALQGQGQLFSLSELFASGCITLSHEHGVRKPSPSLYAIGFSSLLRHGLQAGEILYVTHRLTDDLAAAKAFGVRTALLAADANCCQVSSAEVRDPALKPDRLLTDLRQIGQILGI